MNSEYDVVQLEINVINATTTTVTTTTETTTTTTSTTTSIPITTEPTSVKFGDINLDGTVDASDASAVLTYYAKSSTGYEGTLEDFMTEENPDIDSSLFAEVLVYGKFGDVNSDGVVDASDASAILTYYAKSSTGYEGTLEEFMKSATI